MQVATPDTPGGTLKNTRPGQAAAVPRMQITLPEGEEANTPSAARDIGIGTNTARAQELRHGIEDKAPRNQGELPDTDAAGMHTMPKMETMQLEHTADLEHDGHRRTRIGGKTLRREVMSHVHNDTAASS